VQAPLSRASQRCKAADVAADDDACLLLGGFAILVRYILHR
jgi:hypothetical protein